MNEPMLMQKTSDTYFLPGDLVVLKQSISNKPKMVVKSADKISDSSMKPKLLGITCMWFNTKQELQTARFSTKDLKHYE